MSVTCETVIASGRGLGSFQFCVLQGRNRNMANRTDTDTKFVRGTDPQRLVDKLTREKIYNSRFWKECCFGVSVADVAKLSTDLRYAGGMYGHLRKPTPFMCLLLKLLQLGPERDVVGEFLIQPHFKYGTLLALLYLRLVGDAIDIYRTLENYLSDYRKIAMRLDSGGFELTHIDQITDRLLRDDAIFGTRLPTLQRRHVLKELGLGHRVSSLASHEHNDCKPAG